MRLDYCAAVNRPASAIYFQSAASIDPRDCRSSRGRLYWKRKRGLILASAFLLPGCRRVCSVAVSHEEDCFLKGSQDCVALDLTKSATAELKLRVKMIGSEGDGGVPAPLSLGIMTSLLSESGS